MIVVFFSTVDRPGIDDEDYGRTNARMEEIMASIPGFISYNSYVSDDGDGLAVDRINRPFLAWHR